MVTKSIYLIRHGETDWNLEERFQGHIDIPLNDTGRKQAQALIPIVKSYMCEAVLSSDLSRAYETASIIASSLDLPVFKNPDFREAFLGEAQGLTRTEVEARFGHQISRQLGPGKMTDADVSSNGDISYPGSETSNQVVERVFRALEVFLQSHPFTKIAVVTHGGVIRRVMQKLTSSEQTQRTPNGAIYLIEYCSDLTPAFRTPGAY